MKLVFGDIVVVDEGLIGVVVKNWGVSSKGKEASVDVYVRNWNDIRNFPLSQVERYQVRHKYLDDEELQYQELAESEQ